MMRAFFSSTAVLVLLAACSSDDGGAAGPPGGGSPVFIAGHGVRELAYVSRDNTGLSTSIATADVSLSAPGVLEWCYGIGTPATGHSELHLRTLDLATAATLGEPAVPNGVLTTSINEERGIQYVPYTNKLFGLVKNAAGGGIDGDVHFIGIGDAGTRGFRAYASGQVLYATKGGYYSDGRNDQYSSDLTARVATFAGEKTTPLLVRHVVPTAPAEDRQLYRAAAFERVPSGDVIAIAISGDAVIARNMADGAVLATLPYTGLAETYNSPITPLRMRTKLSREGDKIGCLLGDVDNPSAPPRVTTISYDVLAKALSIVINDIVPTRLTASFFDVADFDPSGNLFYGANIDPVGQTGLAILEEGAAGSQVLATGFVPDTAFVGISLLKEIDGKVFLGFSAATSIGTLNIKDGPKSSLGIIER